MSNLCTAPDHREFNVFRSMARQPGWRVRLIQATERRERLRAQRPRARPRVLLPSPVMHRKSSPEVLMAPSASYGSAALKLPGPASYPPVDEHVVRPETREEMVRGERVFA